MVKTSNVIRRMGVLAGIAAIAATASAMPLDTHISIDRALNSPTLNVRYSGTHAALVELRINGESIGTRSVAATKDSGETDFNINPSDLKDGDNSVEIRLFDRTGKLVGSDKTNISADQSNQGPVFVTSPKLGATVRGAVDVKIGFGKELKNSYVSFFVDSNFKKMSNYPPFVFSWDTTRETNGWHVVEAWAIDENSETFKSQQTRVFVDNPGGHTYRNGGDDVAPTAPGFKANAVGGPVDVRSNSYGGPTASTKGRSVAPSTVSNGLHPSIAGSPSGIKPAPTEHPLITGPKSLTPTHKRVAMKSSEDTGDIAISLVGQKVPSASTLNGFNSAARMVSIVRGQRVPNVGAFAIKLNDQFVKFDVQPRVDDGVPMTPFRYLLEKDGGKVDWANLTKTVTANAQGKDIVIQIGDKNALVNRMTMTMEVTPYIDRGRTIVPLSFIHDALNLDVQYDKETGHVLISTAKK